VTGRLRRVASGDAGISLAEMLVAMMIFALLIAMTSGLFISAVRANGSNRDIDASTRSASNGMNELTRIIRAGSENPRPKAVSATADPAFVLAGSSTLTVYAFVNLADSLSTPRKVTFAVEGGNLVETTVVGVETAPGSGFWNYPGTGAKRILAGPVVPTSAGGAVLFTYLDSAGAVLPVPGGSVAGDRVTEIAAVTVQLQVGKTSASKDSTTLVSTVGLPNVPIARNP